MSSDLKVKRRMFVLNTGFDSKSAKSMKDQRPGVKAGRTTDELGSIVLNLQIRFLGHPASSSSSSSSSSNRSSSSSVNFNIALFSSLEQTHCALAACDSKFWLSVALRPQKP